MWRLGGGRWWGDRGIAIGDVSVGVISVAGLAIGGLMLGGLAVGLLAAGGAVIGWEAAFGGLALTQHANRSNRTGLSK